MKYFVFTGLLLLSISSMFGQTPMINFHKAYGGSADDEVVDMIFNSNGNLVLFGSTRSSDYDLSLSQPALPDFWLFELDDEGNIISNTTFGGTGVDVGLEVFQDDNNGYFLIGYTNSPEITGEEEIGSFRTSVHYLNQDDEFQWGYTYPCFSCSANFSENYPVDAQILPSGNIAILVRENLSAGRRNILICIDPMGNLLWESQADLFFGANPEMSLLFMVNQELIVSGRASTIGNWGAHCQSRFSFDGDLIESYENISSFFTQDSEYPGAGLVNEFGEMIIASRHNFYGGLECYADQALSMIPINGNTLALSTYDESRTILDTHYINCDWNFWPSEIFRTRDNGYLVIGVGRYDGAENNPAVPNSYTNSNDTYIIKYRYDMQIQNVFHIGGSLKDGYSQSGANAFFNGDHVTGVLNGEGCLLLSITSESADIDMEVENGPYGEYDVHLFNLDCSNWFDQDCSDCGLTFVEGGDNQDQAGTDCTDPTACNYNPNATEDDGSCEYGNYPYDCNGNCLNDADQNGICDEFEQAAPFNPDANGDGVINLLDMLEIFPLYGQPFEVVPCVNPE
jgi:hypothetical protein